MSTEPLAEMSRDQLIERIEELERQKRHHEARMDAMSKKLDRFERFLIGDRDLGEDFVDTADDVWSRIENAEDQAETAVAVAKKGGGDDGGDSKKTVAKRLSRNETVITAAIKAVQEHGSVDAPTVQDMAKPQMRIEHRTIFDAWEDLELDWPCFNVRDGDPGPHGENKRLECKKDALPDSLVRMVRNELSDDEVIEKLNNYLSSGRGA